MFIRNVDDDHLSFLEQCLPVICSRCSRTRSSCMVSFVIVVWITLSQYLGIDEETLEQLINFSYSGKVRISSSNVQSLMVGASFLQLNNIVDACSQFLQKRLQGMCVCLSTFEIDFCSGSNVLLLRSFAVALGCTSLVRSADRFIDKHFVSISGTPEFLQLSLDDLVSIISRDQLYVSSEEQVFLFVFYFCLSNIYLGVRIGNALVASRCRRESRFGCKRSQLHTIAIT